MNAKIKTIIVILHIELIIENGRYRFDLTYDILGN